MWLPPSRYGAPEVQPGRQGSFSARPDQNATKAP